MDISQQNIYREFLGKFISRYSLISPESLVLLQDIVDIRFVRKNELILDVNTICKDVYVIYTGAIVSYFLCEDGDTYHKNIFIEGDLVVFTVSAITQTPSKFALQTIEDCTLIHFPYAKFRELILCNNDLENFYIAYLEKTG